MYFNYRIQKIPSVCNAVEVTKMITISTVMIMATYRIPHGSIGKKVHLLPDYTMPLS